MWLKRWVLKPFFHLTSKVMANVATRGHRKTAEMWRSFIKMDDLIVAIIRELNEKNIDALICPGFAYPGNLATNFDDDRTNVDLILTAPPLTNPARLVPCVSYTAAYNVLDFPVGTVPVSKVIQKDQVRIS